MRLAHRLSVAAAAALLLATGLQLATAPQHVAAAAPVTCSTSAKIFDNRNGNLYYYEHYTPGAGTASWSHGRLISTGFNGQTAIGPDGLIYYATASGELLRYRYDGTQWTEIATVVGTGWQRMNQPYYRMTVDSAGRLFAADEWGVLRVFDSRVPRWDLERGIPLDVDWRKAPIAVGDNVFYEWDDYATTLYRWRYDPDSQRFTRSDSAIGSGFVYLDGLFSPGGDVLYRTAQNGLLYWYRYDADTGTWANNGNGQVIGSGWTNNRYSIGASPNACSTAAPARVSNVTPVAPDPQHAVQAAGRQVMTFAYRGADGRAYQHYGNGSATAVGDKVFASDLSSASGSRVTLTGIDATGQVWISQDPDYLSTWATFGRGMTSVRLNDPGSVGGRIQAFATDTAGNLWWRTEWHGLQEHPTWTAWRRVFRDAPFRGFDDVGTAGVDTFGTKAASGITYWFAIHPQNGNEYATGPVQLGGSFGPPVHSNGYQNNMTLFARHKTNGQAYLQRGDMHGFASATTWAPLPPLTADGSVTLDTVPMAVDEWQGRFVVATRGSDGFVYATTQVTSNGNEFYPWQRFAIAPAANAPSLSDGISYGMYLSYRGQDGQLYVYVLGSMGAGAATFTGGRQ